MATISEASNSQKDTKTYRPLIYVKNGLVGKIFSDGIVCTDAVKKLIFPYAEYDWLLRATIFTKVTDGAYKFSGMKNYLVRKGQTEFDTDPETSFVFYDGEMVIKQ